MNHLMCNLPILGKNIRDKRSRTLDQHRKGLSCCKRQGPSHSLLTTRRKMDTTTTTGRRVFTKSLQLAKTLARSDHGSFLRVIRIDVATNSVRT